MYESNVTSEDVVRWPRRFSRANSWKRANEPRDVAWKQVCIAAEDRGQEQSFWITSFDELEKSVIEEIAEGEAEDARSRRSGSG